MIKYTVEAIVDGRRAAGLALAVLAFAASAVPASAQSVLVSNIGQTSGATSNLAAVDMAQGFTTGSNTHGYTLTSVEVSFAARASNVTVRVERSGVPAGTGLVATLTNPTSVISGNNTFTAPAGALLRAKTTYFVVVEANLGSVDRTQSTSEDSAAAGWSIANNSVRRDATSDGTWTMLEGPMLIRVSGTVNTVALRPSTPGQPTVAKGSKSGSLAVSWAAPSSTSAITDYDLRYFKGSMDPDSESDWVTEGVPGLPDPGTATADTIRGLLANTAYRVQVRAANANGEGPWSTSGSQTTAAAPATNNAPRVVEDPPGSVFCAVKGDLATPWGTLSMASGTTVSQGNLVTRGTETTEWPDACSGRNRIITMFDDRDADALIISISYTQPANMRFFGGTPRVVQPTTTSDGQVFFSGFTAFQHTTMRVDITATDPHGASASTHMILNGVTSANTVGAPSFSSTASGQSYAVNEAITDLVLPAATGGDTSPLGTVMANPYFYTVSGLPPGLTFDDATRTISGTPTVQGSYTVTYKAEDLDGDDDGDTPDPMDTAVQTFVIAVTGDILATDPPGAPGTVTVEKGPTSGSLKVSWSAAASAVAITDYDLRYFKGSMDPDSESDWVTEGVPGLPDPGTATADTIRGLLANTAYRVQVRAANANGEGPWSTSGSQTTAAAPATNNAPRVVEDPPGSVFCAVKGDLATPWGTLSMASGTTVSQGNLVTRGTETTEWPDACSGRNRIITMFDDRDADALIISISYTQPANMRFFGGTPRVVQPTTTSDGQVFFSGFTAFQHTTMRVDITATDPHGASASTHMILNGVTSANTVGAPSFSSTASGQSYAVNEAITDLVLPAATGGDTSPLGTVMANPYFYTVSGLPPGLTFDDATRTISGTPTVAGSYTVTYKAEDLDGANEGDTPDPMDTAVQTFDIVVASDEPVIQSVEIVSFPSLDRSGDGTADTY
ncbi:MAG: fibronectin type III domain-containing protein, partial [Gemmatimonadetes bacterium]|nr:fibronectin type III domain-containing protein [Candidatus Palauibacter australiensis]